MSKLLSLAGAAAIAVALSFSISAPSFAFDHQQRNDQGGDPGAAFVAGTAGFIAGAAAASGGYSAPDDNQGDYPHHHMHGRWRHAQACEAQYGWRYNPDTDMVRGRYHHFFPCDL